MNEFKALQLFYINSPATYQKQKNHCITINFTAMLLFIYFS